MSKDYSYNKKKLKSRQGRAIYGLLGQQLGGMGAVVAGGTKGNILGRYAAGSIAGMGAGYLAGGHLPMSDNGSLDYTVERAIKKYKKTGKKNATFRDLEKNYDLKLSKQASLENFYMVKEASRLKKVLRNPFKKAPLDPARKKVLEADLAKKLKNPEASGVEVKSLSDLFG